MLALANEAIKRQSRRSRPRHRYRVRERREEAQGLRLVCCLLLHSDDMDMDMAMDIGNDTDNDSRRGGSPSIEPFPLLRFGGVAECRQRRFKNIAAAAHFMSLSPVCCPCYCRPPLASLLLLFLFPFLFLLLLLSLLLLLLLLLTLCRTLRAFINYAQHVKCHFEYEI